MKYYKYFYWAYLLLGVLFILDGIKKLNDGEEGAFVSLALAALAVFMFFFRRNFAKKLEDRMKK